MHCDFPYQHAGGDCDAEDSHHLPMHRKMMNTVVWNLESLEGMTYAGDGAMALVQGRKWRNAA